MGRISWKRINQVIEAIEAAGSSGFFRQVIEQLNLLAPADHATATPNVNLDEIRQRVGRPNPKQVTWNAPTGYWEDYLRYYEARDPRQNASYYREHTGAHVVDTSFMDGTEFGDDFLKKYGARFCLRLSNLAPTRGRGFVVSLYRSGKKPFTDTELESATALFPHVHNLSLFAADPLSREAARAQDAAAAAGLSRREQDVAVLLSRRMSILEIADRLFISRHTVEKHMQHVYWKMNASGKSDVRRLLLGDQAD